MTREELRGIVEGITDEQLSKILNIHSLDIGKAKGDREALQTELDGMRAYSAELEEKVGAMEKSQCEADEMKLKVEELQKVIDQNTQAEAERMAEAKISQRFDQVSAGKKFVNEMTHRAVFEEFRTALECAENAGRSDSEIYQELVENRENIFEPQGGIPSLIGSTMGFGGDLTDSDVREIMGLN